MNHAGAKVLVAGHGPVVRRPAVGGIHNGSARPYGEIISGTWNKSTVGFYKYPGCWFGTWLLFSIYGIIIPTDFHIFQRGRSTTIQNIIQNLRHCVNIPWNFSPYIAHYNFAWNGHWSWRGMGNDGPTLQGPHSLLWKIAVTAVNQLQKGCCQHLVGYFEGMKRHGANHTW